MSEQAEDTNRWAVILSSDNDSNKKPVSVFMTDFYAYEAPPVMAKLQLSGAKEDREIIGKWENLLVELDYLALSLGDIDNDLTLMDILPIGEAFPKDDKL